MTPNQAKMLAGLERELPKNAINCYHSEFSQHCGVLNLGTDTIEILPKIAGKEGNPDMCRKVLLRMEPRG